MGCPRHRCVWIAVVWMCLAAHHVFGNGPILDFHQVDWDGLGIVQNDSSWGYVELDFLGTTNEQYLNVNVDGNWAVQNIPVISFAGDAVQQKQATFFDLGVANGIDLTNLSFDFTLTNTEQTIMPSGALTNAPVSEYDYQIGGVGDANAGNEAPANAMNQPNPGAKVVKEAKLPFLKQALANAQHNMNQPLGTNDCARGNVSNSLNYLKATRQLGAARPTDLGTIDTLLGGKAADNRSPGAWAKNKQDNAKNVYARGQQSAITTSMVRRSQLAPGKTGFTNQQLMNLVEAIRRGHDVEVEIRKGNDGHVMMVTGIKLYDDGSIGLHVLDDTQKDGRNGTADPIKFYMIKRLPIAGGGGATSMFLNKVEVRKFVIERHRDGRRARQPVTPRGQSRGNSVNFDAGTGLLTFANDFMIGTDIGGPDPIIGAELLAPAFRIEEVNLAEGRVVFDRNTLDSFQMVNGADTYMHADAATMVYDIDTNQFYTTMFNIAMSGTDPSGPFFDPTLTNIFSPLFEQFEAVLDPASLGFDPEAMLYLTYVPDFDMFSLTNGFIDSAGSPITNYTFAGYEIPEPATGLIALFLAGYAATRRRRCWLR